MMKISVKKQESELRYGGELIRRTTGGMVSLTDMYRASGSQPNKDPSQWLRLSSTIELVSHISNMGISHIWRTSRGNSGGTWAVPALAITYASYLSIEFYVWAHQQIAAQLRDASPPSADSRRSKQIAQYVKSGKSLSWATRRVDGIPIRHKFTDALKAHGVNEPWQYGACTNAVYKALLGQDKNGLIYTRNLPVKANMRDHFSTVENAAVSMCEALAEAAVEDCGLHGQHECRGACEASGEAIKISLEKNRQFIEQHRKRS